MGAESIPDIWLEAMREAEELDPIIREALRPVYERLKEDVPHEATAFAMAMIFRALRMIEVPPGWPMDRTATREQLAHLCAIYVTAHPDHP